MLVDFDKTNDVTIWLVTDPDDTEPKLSLTGDFSLTAGLFTDLPTRSELVTGAGAVFLVNSASYENPKTITLPKVADPDPLGDAEKTAYYLGLKYSFDGISFNYSIHKIWYRRPVSYLSYLEVDTAAIKNLDKSVAYHFGETSTTLDFIATTAKNQLLSYLRKKGVEISTIRNLGDLKIATTFLALKIAFTTEIRAVGDGASEKADRYARLAEEAIEGLVLDLGNEARLTGDLGDRNEVSTGSIRTIF